MIPIMEVIMVSFRDFHDPMKANSFPLLVPRRDSLANDCFLRQVPVLLYVLTQMASRIAHPIPRIPMHQ